MANSTQTITNADGSKTTVTYNAMGAEIGRTTTAAPAQQESPTAGAPSTQQQVNSASPQQTYTSVPTTSTSIGGQTSNVTQNTAEAALLAQQSQQGNLALQDDAQAAKASQMSLASRLQAEAEARRLGYLSTTQSQNPVVTRGAGIDPNEQAARNAAFGRAKDQAGQTALASVRALENVMSGRGMQGSTIEGGHMADVMTEAGGGIEDYITKQLTTDLNRAADVQDNNFDAAITQRGQNLDALASLMGLITASSGTLY